MLDHLRIRSRIAEIRKRVIRLQDIAKDNTKDAFLDEEGFIADAAERNLEVAMQACLDIASHVVAQLALEKPKENKEIFLILAKHKIINEQLAEKLLLMSGMRNILVHEYLEVDEEKIYHSITNDLKDIISFASEIERFLEEHK